MVEKLQVNQTIKGMNRCLFIRLVCYNQLILKIYMRVATHLNKYSFEKLRKGLYETNTKGLVSKHVIHDVKN